MYLQIQSLYCVTILCPVTFLVVVCLFGCFLPHGRNEIIKIELLVKATSNKFDLLLSQ